MRLAAAVAALRMQIYTPLTSNEAAKLDSVLERALKTLSNDEKEAAKIEG